ncbi:MAG: OmpA family protein [Halieaceae bacterium]|uniref:OmpA family protein n=1 Tax=Haliea alexandrii TaxID=2448162 RepID=UPI001304BE15|nr:OmpA family protein [Haliea alexandrii]MCR9186011.1 OmpA family protein [Halieaceae bacterium]
MVGYIGKVFLVVCLYIVASAAVAQDVEGVIEHPMIERYPGQVIAWQHIENYQPYKVAIGPVAGYRSIADWIETEGRVTRTFYKYEGEDRTFSEIYKNYLDALKQQGFEIIGEGMSADRKGVAVGSRQWMEVTFRANPAAKPGAVGTMFAGTSSSGGAGAIVASKERAAGLAYVVVYVEQHSNNYVGTLIDIVEVEAAETGLVVVDAEAIGSDIEEYGRVVLDGIVFDFDKATLRAESNAALEAIVSYLRANPEKQFYVVGHTDSKGTFDYNRTLSADRARAVVEALKNDYDIASGRLQPHGVGPLVPVFSNGSDAGRERNRRVELVER